MSENLTTPSIISIHALLAESDSKPRRLKSRRCVFLSTLSLRRATRLPTALRTPHHRFLSTLSLRRATHFPCTELYQQRYFYPRSPCGERRFSSCRPDEPSGISIHALLAESDGHHRAYLQYLCISIHALLAESDPAWLPYFPMEQRFLSTLSLRRATCFFCVKLLLQLIFLSTLSLRRAT